MGHLILTSVLLAPELFRISLALGCKLPSIIVMHYQIMESIQVLFHFLRNYLLKINQQSLLVFFIYNKINKFNLTLSTHY